jgi:hypothetical protein
MLVREIYFFASAWIKRISGKQQNGNMTLHVPSSLTDVETVDPRSAATRWKWPGVG